MRPWRDAWTAAIPWGVAASAIHSVGNHTGLHFEYGWYQNLTHACSASAMAALVAVAGLNRGLSGRHLVAFVLAASAVGAVDYRSRATISPQWSKPWRS